MGGSAVVSAVLTAFAAAGFWTTGHFQMLVYPSVASCERDRPRVEATMAAHGCTGVFTTCRPVVERGA
jgi:hypothetical protein